MVIKRCAVGARCAVCFALLSLLVDYLASTMLKTANDDTFASFGDAPMYTRSQFTSPQKTKQATLRPSGGVFWKEGVGEGGEAGEAFCSSYLHRATPTPHPKIRLSKVGGMWLLCFTFCQPKVPSIKSK